MKNYDDLQRFKEKTQTLDIAFKDMSGQLQQPAENSQWALIRQLANEDASTPFSGSQRIDLPQPRPLRGDEFHAPATSPLMRQPAAALPAARGSILDSLTDRAPAAAARRSSLFPAPPEAAPVSIAPVQAPGLSAAPRSSLFPAPPEAVPAQAPGLSAAAPVSITPAQALRPPVAAPAPRFGGLFRARHSEPASLPKETLLKPLLEKIALCR
ncbi:cellulose biosynthesis protein BcsO [Pantoea sp. ACRSH]|uniref:cellulose biosynthesis protein BcsO n=3 Tax=Pantoea TaxID=53335 RepID=UPI001EF5603D|nr:MULTISPECIES: cellulose biosynthesis protein BcsO [unclassified Pantoea]MCG7366408.1 cellulose biosynthesis protein BcsO [Pantoea sp. ACRSH]MCG7397037.1 cellulose biosynthesis protein BcsO [Pantoea sp. ACRSC]